MKKVIIAGICCITLGVIGCITSCGTSKQGEQKMTTASPSAQPAETAEAKGTLPSRTANKTVLESFGMLLTEEDMKSAQEIYSSEEYDEVRNNDISDWKDQQGNYKYPEGYKIAYNVPLYRGMAAQQMPEELLKEISTEDLYQLIADAPGDWCNVSDTYLGMLASYYHWYNFMENFMEREDAAEVVHQQYQKYTQKQRKKYSKQNSSWQPKSQKQLQERGKFQLIEGLEWFFRYQKGKKVPDDRILGYEWLKEI